MSVQVIVQHHAKDFDQWKPVFDENGEVRRKHGGKGHRLYRTLEDPNTLVVVSEFESAEGAEAFIQDPKLKEAMDRAGVDVKPNIWICENVENVDY